MFCVLDQPRAKLRWEAQGHQTLDKKPKYLFVLISNQQRLPSQHTCSRSTIETLEKGKKHMFKVTYFIPFSIVDSEQVNISRLKLWKRQNQRAAQ